MRSDRFAEFNKWCAGSMPDIVGGSYDAQGQVGRTDPTDEQFVSFISNAVDRISKQSITTCSVNVVIPEGGYAIDRQEGGNDLLKSLSISCFEAPKGRLTIRDLKLWNVSIDWRGHSDITEPVVFENCDIATLTLQNDSRITLVNSNVGNLSIHRVHQIHMKGGCVLNIQVTAPGADVPITGSVNFSSTFFPRNRFKYLLPGAQPYRNMRHHLRSIENGHMANLFHSAELAVERADDTFLNKCLSYAYEWLSDFGSSALRPLLWWVLLYVCAIAVILYSDGAVRAFEPDASYQGWREILIDHGLWYSDLLRANYLSFRSMINPLGLFGIRELIVPAYGWLVLLLSIVGLLSVVLIALFVLAVRRRFKMQM